MDTKEIVKETNATVRHYFRLGKPWMRTAGMWLGVGGLLGLYFTDWKLILGYVPFIKDKYEREPPK